MFSYNETTNDNGNRHLEIMEEHRLVAANTLFKKRLGKLWTWTSPHNTHHQLDYIFVRSKWKNSVTNCEAYNTFGTLFSDHRVVTAKVSQCLRLTKSNASSKVAKYIWSDRATNKEMQSRYAVEVRNRYQLLLKRVKTNKIATTISLSKPPQKQPRNVYDRFPRASRKQKVLIPESKR